MRYSGTCSCVIYIYQIYTHINSHKNGLSPENACFYSVQNLLPCVCFNRLENKIYRTVIRHEHQQLHNKPTTIHRFMMCFPHRKVAKVCLLFIVQLLDLMLYNQSVSEPGSVVGIATAYGLDGPGIGSRWGRDFPHLSRPSLRPTQPPVQWVPVFPGGKMRPGRVADPSPLLVPRSKIE